MNQEREEKYRGESAVAAISQGEILYPRYREREKAYIGGVAAICGYELWEEAKGRRVAVMGCK